MTLNVLKLNYKSSSWIRSETIKPILIFNVKKCSGILKTISLTKPRPEKGNNFERVKQLNLQKQ